MRLKAGVFLVAVVFALASFAFGQERGGAITGTVTDESGAVVPAATVTITNTDTGVVARQLTTNKEGIYNAPRLQIGHYSVSADAAGFQKSTVKGIEVNVADVIRINPTLKAGATSQTVEVTASALEVQTQEASSGTLVTGAQIRELSINNRNYEQLVAMAPGVSYGAGDQLYIGTTNPSGQTNVVSFSINGQRNSANLWTVDGADNVDRGSNLTLLNYPSVDAIAEFKVIRNIYSSEYGRAAGGNVNVITRSGSKDFHGNAYEFVRNDIFNANRVENNASKIKRPPLRYNDFGYTIGGPVDFWSQNKKTFFFFSQEFRRQNVPGTFTAKLPTANEKMGVFTRNVCTDPNTYTSSCGGAVGTTVAINPVAQQYINAIWASLPDPQNPVTHDFTGTRQSVFNHRQELVRLDHTFSPNWSVMFRFINDHIPTEEPGGLFTNAALPGVSNTETDSPGRSYMAKTTNTLGGNMLMEVGYAKSYGAIVSRPVGLLATAFGQISTPLPFPVTLQRIPNTTFSNGPSAVIGFGPYDDFNRNHNVFANLSKIFAKHTFKFGVDYNHYQKTENAGGGNNGGFAFNANGAQTTGLSGDALADANFQQAWANFLVGDVATFTQANFDLTPDINSNQFDWYVQDDWKLRPNLTLNMGLRHSIFFSPHDENHFLTTFDPTLYDPTKAPIVDPVTGLITSPAGTFDPLNGISINGSTSPHGNKIAPTSFKNFAPRLGFAWDIFGDGKTAMRGGYGISYDASLVGILEQNIFVNPPFVNNVTIPNTRLESPASGAPTISSAPRALRGTSYTSDTPYVQSWSLDVQRSLFWDSVVAVGYYGNKGTHLLGIVDLNQPRPGQLPIVNGRPQIAEAIQAIRPFKGYDSINTVLPIMTSNYNSLQASWQKRFSTGGQVSLNYTWSKGLTTSQTDRSSSPQNVYDINADYGPSQLDRRHIFNGNFVYELPFYRNQEGVIGHILGGWQTSGIVYLYSGLPLTITTSGVDPAGQGYNRAGSSASGRPDLVADPRGQKGTGFLTGTPWFNTAAFAPVCPASGPCAVSRPGTSGRGVVYGPGFERVDLSLFKNIRITERVKLQFRTEAFNVFNHTNPNTVNTVQTQATFGKITGYRDPREMQFGLKLSF